MTAAAARHIVVLMHDFPLGGTERIMIRLANDWQARGRMVTILCGSEAGPARPRVAAGVTVHGIAPAIPRGVFSRIRLGRAASRVLPALGADILVAPGNFHLPIIGAIPPSIAPPIVCKLSNPLATRHRHPLADIAFRAGIRYAARRIDMLVAMSPALRDEAARVLGDRAIAVLPEPVLPSPAAPRTGHRRGAVLRLLCAGRMVPQKRFDLALRTLAAFGDGAMLTFAGDGPERPRLERLARTLGIARQVRFLGAVAGIDGALAQADLLLLTSAFEGYPAVLVEALAAGVPVVTTACSPAVGEILAHPSFGIVAGATPAALADAVRIVGDRPAPDRAALATLTDRHESGRAAAAWLDLLDRVVREHAARTA